MSIRAWVPAIAGVLLLSEFTAAHAQPVVPVRPRSSPFGNVLGSGFGGSPYLQQQQQRIQQSQQFQMNQQGGVLAPNSLYYNSQFGGPYLNASGALPQFLPGAYQLLDPTQQQQTGVVGRFNTTGSYFGGNLGHWYPGGYRGGQGVTAGTLGGGGGGGGGGFAIGGGRGAGGLNGGLTGGMRGGPAALLNTGFMAGATMNQFRR